ncbi:MAG TPA: hypothetical protein VFQ53_05345 [Kofleriaceae bacterium]|nr:hypothetical protein [Kofleriaceae bacterium]
MIRWILLLALASCALDSVGDDDPTLGGKADGISGNGCTRGAMFVMGTPRNFGVAPGGSLPMACVNGVWQVDELFAGTGNVFAAGAFKFHSTGNWQTGTNWGDSHPLDGIAEEGGDGNDIVIEQPGRYRLRFNDRTLEYDVTRLPSSCASSTMFVRGTFNGWGTQPMFCVGQNEWAAIPMLINTGEQLKLDTGTWSVNWGDSNADGIAERNGANIRFDQPGRYLLTFDEATGAYSARLVSAACAWPVMYVRGDFNAWQPFAMECENGHYAITLDGGATGTGFKFDANGDWSVNWGDTDGNFWADRNGNNIRITGKHHVHFYNEQRYAYDRHD